MFKVHKDATTFDLSGLSPETTYRFEMFTKYGNESFFVNSTNPPKFSFVTAEEGMWFYIIFTLRKSMEKYLRHFPNNVCGGGRRVEVEVNRFCRFSRFVDWSWEILQECVIFMQWTMIRGGNGYVLWCFDLVIDLSLFNVSWLAYQLYCLHPRDRIVKWYLVKWAKIFNVQIQKYHIDKQLQKPTENCKKRLHTVILALKYMTAFFLTWYRHLLKY